MEREQPGKEHPAFHCVTASAAQCCSHLTSRQSWACAPVLPGGQSAGPPPLRGQHCAPAGITEPEPCVLQAATVQWAFSSVIFFSIEGWDLGRKGKQILFS